jgi:hypothetical protein
MIAASAIGDIQTDISSMSSTSLNSANSGFANICRSSSTAASISLNSNSIGIADPASSTALVAAVRSGSHTALVQALDSLLALEPAEALAAINSRDDCGYTALVWSTLLGHYDDAQLLLDRGAGTECLSMGGVAALHAAAEKGHIDIVNLLLDSGADPNLQGEQQQTPLMLACKHGHDDVVDALLQAGATAGMTDREGRTATDLAASDSVKVVLDEYSQFSLRLYKAHGETEPEKAHVHIHTDEQADAHKHGHTHKRRGAGSVAGSDASSRTAASRMSRVSKTSRASRASLGSRSSAASSRIVASRQASGAHISLRRNQTSDWLDAINALTKEAAANPTGAVAIAAADANFGARATSAPPPTTSAGRVLHSIPGSPYKWKDLHSKGTKPEPINELYLDCDSDQRLVDSASGRTSILSGDATDILSIDSALLHGVWVLKKMGNESRYHRRLMWIEVAARGSDTHATFLCWSKDGYRSNCKRLPLALAADIQGPTFEAAKLPPGILSGMSSPRSEQLSSHGLDARGRARTLSGASCGSNGSNNSFLGHPGLRWLAPGAPAVDGMVLRLRRKKGPSLDMKFDDSAVYTPYQWKAALLAAKHFESNCNHNVTV